MNNSDMPAMPITIAPSSDVIAQAQGAGMNLPRTIHHSGLTKREHFAAMAMQGICSTYQPEHMGDDGSDARICAKYAIEHADALLAALEKQ